jgi:hypothetical protein
MSAERGEASPIGSISLDVGSRDAVRNNRENVMCLMALPKKTSRMKIEVKGIRCWLYYVCCGEELALLVISGASTEKEHAQSRVVFAAVDIIEGK